MTVKWREFTEPENLWLQAAEIIKANILTKELRLQSIQHTNTNLKKNTLYVRDFWFRVALRYPYLELLKGIKWFANFLKSKVQSIYFEIHCCVERVTFHRRLESLRRTALSPPTVITSAFCASYPVLPKQNFIRKKNKLNSNWRFPSRQVLYEAKFTEFLHEAKKCGRQKVERLSSYLLNSHTLREDFHTQ